MNDPHPNIEVFNPDKFIELVVSVTPGARVQCVKTGDRDFHFVELTRFGFSHSLVLPYGLYISSSDQKEKEIESILAHRSHEFTINFPLHSMSLTEANSIAEKNNCMVVQNVCHILETNQTVEEIFRGFNETRRKHINRYKRSNQLRVFKTKEPRYFVEYYKLYEHTQQRWGGGETAYSRELIKNLHEVPGMYMWVAELNGELISAMICIYYQDYVFDWLAASIITEENKKLYAPVAVQYEVIADAVECGYKYVNMGASKNLGGVSDFKDSWGAKEEITLTLRKQSSSLRLLKKMKGVINKIRS